MDTTPEIIVQPAEVKLYIVDDHEVVRYGLAMSLVNFTEEMSQNDLHINIVGMAQTGKEALEVFPTTGANFAMIDVILPDMSGLEVIRRLRHLGYDKQKLPILVVTELVKPNVREMFTSGASGYIDKKEDSSVFIRAIQSLLANPNQPWMLPDVAQKLQRMEIALKAYGLTPHEIEILQMIHFSNHEIAEIFQVSLGTVRTHLSNIYDKLNVSARKDAMEIAKRLGLSSLNY